MSPEPWNGPLIWLAVCRQIKPSERVKLNIELGKQGLNATAVVLNLGDFGFLVGNNVLGQLRDSFLKDVLLQHGAVAGLFIDRGP